MPKKPPTFWFLIRAYSCPFVISQSSFPPRMPKLLHLVVACAENRVIGRDGQLPWRIPEDARHFRALTAGNICVLGRICFDTWPGAVRDHRQPIVVTHHPLPGSVSEPSDLTALERANRGRGDAPPSAVPSPDVATRVRAGGPDPSNPGARLAGGRSVPIAVGTLPAALRIAESLPGEIFVCGGQQIFEETLALPRTLRLHLTLIHADIAGDRYFPEWRHLPWHEVDRRESRDDHFRYTFQTLDLVR